MNFSIELLLIGSTLVIGALSNIIFIKRLFNSEASSRNQQPSTPLFPPENVKFYHALGCEAILIVLFFLVLATYAGIGESPLLAILLSLGGLVLGWIVPFIITLIWATATEESSPATL